MPMSCLVKLAVVRRKIAKVKESATKIAPIFMRMDIWLQRDHRPIRDVGPIVATESLPADPFISSVLARWLGATAVSSRHRRPREGRR
jgi:hypothetical protein